MGISNVSVQSRPPTSHSTPQARRQPPFNRAKTQVNPGTVDFESEEHIIMVRQLYYMKSIDFIREHCGGDHCMYIHMVVGFTTTYTISAYQH